MDVVEFVEQVFGLHLMDYQKEFLIKHMKPREMVNQ